MTATLARYKRHASLYGSDFVFESAVGDLGAEDLGHLSTALARQAWRPTDAQRDELALALVEAGWSDGRILRIPSIGQSSLAKAHSKAANKRYNGHPAPHGHGGENGAQSRYCDECGEAFVGRVDARFCSPACRVRAHRRRAA